MESFRELKDTKSIITFLTLPWQDVIFLRIFCHLPLSDISRLRRTSKTFNELCLSYFKYCTSLDCFPVSSKLTEDAIVRITKHSHCLKRLSFANCKSFKDSTLVGVLQRNLNVTSLNISGCNSFSNHGLFAVATCCTNLVQVYLRECRWVSSEAVVKLAKLCKMLEVVDLTGCWEVDDECLVTLVMSCPKITQLCVNGCYGITDTSLHVLSRQLLELARLELDGCWRVTNRAIKMIGEYCHKLRYLNVKDCRDISEASLARLRVKHVIINKKPEIPVSQILTQYFSKPAMHMTPLRFDPTWYTSVTSPSPGYRVLGYGPQFLRRSLLWKSKKMPNSLVRVQKTVDEVGWRYVKHVKNNEN